jgi:hypothetical protein
MNPVRDRSLMYKHMNKEIYSRKWFENYQMIILVE